MRHKDKQAPENAERTVRDIRRATRRQFSPRRRSACSRGCAARRASPSSGDTQPSPNIVNLSSGNSQSATRTTNAVQWPLAFRSSRHPAVILPSLQTYRKRRAPAVKLDGESVIVGRPPTAWHDTVKAATGTGLPRVSRSLSDFLDELPDFGGQADLAPGTVPGFEFGEGSHDQLLAQGLCPALVLASSSWRLCEGRISLRRMSAKLVQVTTPMVAMSLFPIIVAPDSSSV